MLFADISGYTTLSERLDPEEVKDLVGHIIGEIAKVVIKYEGHIEKFAGDQVMALFGVPLAHEDDPVRAVKTASEIHEVVRGLSPQVQETIGQPLAVHIGINTGLAVTGKFDFAKAAHHIAGDTVNVASRLCTLAKSGETLVGQTTYTQAEGFFSFGPMEMVQVKGKTKPVQVYKLLSSRELPGRTHRLSGRRAALIGRQREMAAPGPGDGQAPGGGRLGYRHLWRGGNRQEPAPRGIPGYSGLKENQVDGRTCLCLYPEHFLLSSH